MPQTLTGPAADRAAAIAERCAKATQHGTHWQACCPSHDDRTPSLSITPKHDRVLLKCFAQCPIEAIVAALDLTMADLFVSRPANGHRRPDAIYDYVDEAGQLLYQVLRWPGKHFSQRRPDPVQPGQYLEGPGCMAGVRLVLYHLPAVLTAVQRGEIIYVVEGEKDAETLTRHGLTATTNVRGAGKWEESYTETLRGARVVLLPDNDPQGRAHMAQVAQRLQGTVASLKRVRLLLLPPKGDVSDWLQDGYHTLEDFHREVAQTPVEPDTVPGPETPEEPDTETPATLAASVVYYADLLTLDLPPRERYCDWLLDSSIVMLYGPRGVGKTQALLGLSVSLTTGQPFLTWPITQPVGVLYVDGEMHLEDLRCRARHFAEGRVPAHLAFLPSELVQRRSHQDLTLSKPVQRREIEVFLDAHPDLKVLVLDNVSCLFSGLDENKKQDWEPINAWFIRLRHRGITVIFGHHSGKGGLQRGTSGREDAVDTVIALSSPPGYQAKDGCHFYWRFAKARSVKGETVEMLDVRLEQDADGLTTWTVRALEQTRTERVRTMLLDKVPAQIIAHELDVTASYVYRMKREMGL
jgi:AAA domain-containing protein/CHC2-type zinc finger protein